MSFDIDGNKVFALSVGAGPRTILAHSGWIGNFEDWIATLAPLSERWRTVVYDRRGAPERPWCRPSGSRTRRWSTMSSG